MLPELCVIKGKAASCGNQAFVHIQFPVNQRNRLLIIGYGAGIVLQGSVSVCAVAVETSLVPCTRNCLIIHLYGLLEALGIEQCSAQIRVSFGCLDDSDRSQCYGDNPV